MDSDLRESITALQTIFQKRKLAATWGKSTPDCVAELKKEYRVPARYRNFLLEADPEDVETVTPVERVRLFASSKLREGQIGYAVSEEGTSLITGKDGDWRKPWVVIGTSSLFGDPYFLDVSKLDAEGDCLVYAGQKTEKGLWKVTLAASSFANFLHILAISMDVASGFGEAVFDEADDSAFRQALEPRIKPFDPAAARAKHWT